MHLHKFKYFESVGRRTQLCNSQCFMGVGVPCKLLWCNLTLLFNWLNFLYSYSIVVLYGSFSSWIQFDTIKKKKLK